MKIKRFVDRDMRQVLSRVRKDQGPDAVILSTRRVDDGVEVIAAVDYDEALMRHAFTPASADAGSPGDRAEPASTTARRAVATDANEAPAAAVAPKPEPRTVPSRTTNWLRRATQLSPAPAQGGAPTDESPFEHHTLADVCSELSSLRGLVETQLCGLIRQESAHASPMRTRILLNLARLGLAPDIAGRIVDELEPVEEVGDFWHDPLQLLLRSVPVVDDALLTQGGRIALIGPTGAGKTMTLAKLAAQYVMAKGADGVALVCADACRIGARQHLQALGDIMGIEVFAANGVRELDGLLDRLEDRKLVLIDTEGVGQRAASLGGRLEAWRPFGERVRFYLTLSAAGQEAGLDETVRQFGRLPLAGAVVTKVDEAARLGCVIGTLIRHGLPAAWLADGQQIPDDLHPAHEKKLWLIEEAVARMEASEPRIDECTMAETCGQAGVAHA